MSITVSMTFVITDSVRDVVESIDEVKNSLCEANALLKVSSWRPRARYPAGQRSKGIPPAKKTVRQLAGTEPGWA
ncbi:hypothetical protein ACFVZW_19280 [Streptomyces sp. NPDC059567]|uniref:hypothetical protein n=1 Tax=Streptomyces sp. NPDC059567 TaxID=3346867 RepID=UPI0036CFFAD9